MKINKKKLWKEFKKEILGDFNSFKMFLSLFAFASLFLALMLGLMNKFIILACLIATSIVFRQGLIGLIKSLK